MSPLLVKVLSDATQLNLHEQLQLVSHLINIWGQESNLNEASTNSTKPSRTLSRKELFGCMQGKIKMAPDFQSPLTDLAEYM